MPELRKDPVIGRWVIIATERGKRPHDFAPSNEPPDDSQCPFCEGSEGCTPPEIFAIRQTNSTANGPQWDVRVVPNTAPILRIEGELGRRGVDLYDVMNGIGAHEVIIETPKHIANIADLEQVQIEKIIRTQMDRLLDLEKDCRFRYVLLFRNFGHQAGGGHIRHSRSQLIATPVTPKRVKEELQGSRRYYDFKERCIYCDIIRQEIDTTKRVIADIDGFLAFAPYASRFPFEVCVLPKEHCSDFYFLKNEQITGLAQILKLVYSRLKNVLHDPPYNAILHTAPFRSSRLSRKTGYWRTIEYDYHWHMEIMPRLTRVAGFEWGSGFYINPTPPEEAASFLRDGATTA